MKAMAHRQPGVIEVMTWPDAIRLNKSARQGRTSRLERYERMASRSWGVWQRR